MAAQRPRSGRGGGGIAGDGDKSAETRVSSDLENTPLSRSYGVLCRVM